jgi:hypothetical protein
MRLALGEITRRNVKELLPDCDPNGMRRFIEKVVQA